MPWPDSGLNGLLGQRIGYLKGILTLRKLLEAQPGIEAVPIDSTEELAQALLRGGLGAAIDSYGLEYWRASHGILGFTPVRMLSGSQTPLVISVRKDWPELVAILNKGLAAITWGEMAELYRRWFGQDYLSRIGPQAIFTAAEHSWLAEHPILRVGIDTHWAFIITEPYLSFPAAIFSAADVAYLGGLSALEGKTVAVVRGEATQDWLQKDWPRLVLLPVSNTQEALRNTVFR